MEEIAGVLRLSQLAMVDLDPARIREVVQGMPTRTIHLHMVDKARDMLDRVVVQNMPTRLIQLAIADPARDLLGKVVLLGIPTRQIHSAMVEQARDSLGMVVVLGMPTRTGRSSLTGDQEFSSKKMSGTTSQQT